MYQNEYHLISDQTVTPKGVLALDLNATFLPLLKVISKQLIATTILQANVSQIHTLWCDFYGQWHANGYCVIEGYIEDCVLC